jgi:hypothetical protein
VHRVSHSVDRDGLAILHFDFRLTHRQQVAPVHSSPAFGVIYLAGVSASKTQKQAEGKNS